MENTPGTFEQLLGASSGALGTALWLAMAAAWVFSFLIRLSSRFPRGGVVVNTAVESVTVLAYAVLAILVVFLATSAGAFFIANTVWSWLPKYTGQLLSGVVVTLELLVLSLAIGFLLAVPVGLVQVNGPAPLRWLAKGYCTVIRGTPLLIQLWLLYYGTGSLFQSMPAIRESIFWPILREGYFYGLLALTLSVIGYDGEIMRGAFLAVPKGELEAARAFGMSPMTVLRRIWLPRAVRLVLPNLGGDVISQLKSTPVVSTVTVFDLFGVSSKIRQETFHVYEPLLLVAAIYFALTWLLTRAIAAIEAQVPTKR
jgi:polar amino acid transport system permease protein